MNFKDKLWEMYAVDLPYRDSLSAENGGEYKDSLGSEGLGEMKSKRERFEEFDELFKSDENRPLPGFRPEIHDYDRKTRKPKVEVSKILTSTFSKKMEIIQEAINEINSEIEKRMDISRQFGEEVDEKIEGLAFQLKELERFWLGNANQVIEFRRSRLEADLLALKREKRAERLRAWEDINALILKRRQLTMELENLVTTKEMVG